MIFVDSFLLYKACCGQNARHNPKEFFKHLTVELIYFQNDRLEGMQTHGTKLKRQDAKPSATKPLHSAALRARGTTTNTPSKGVALSANLTQLLFVSAAPT